MPIAATYDGIVIGASHNGLILQAYLAKAGLKVLTIERSLHVGGGLYTAEDPAHPGFSHNVHAVFLRGITALPWYGDLALDSYGLRMLEPEANAALHLEDGRCLIMHVDPEQTARSLARLSQRDADTFRRLRDRYAPVVEEVIGPEQAAAPLTLEEKQRLLGKSEVGRLYLEAAAQSPREFVAAHFASPAMQCLLLEICILREVDVTVRGMGFVVPALIAGARKAQLPVGGSRELARALERCVYAHGGDVLVNRTPRRIVVEQGRARGVELDDGSFIEARSFVVSGLNPLQTLLDLVGEAHLPSGMPARLRRYQFGVVGPLFGVYLALHEAPAYRAAAYDADAGRAFMSIIGLDRPEQIDHLYPTLGAGNLPTPVFGNSAVPTLHDPSQAPPGKHTAFFWQKVPYALRDVGGQGWDALKRDQMAAVLERWRAYAPNLRDDVILDAFAFSPLDTERHFPNMVRGDLNVGWFSAEQIGANRPLPDLSGYRTPIAGLYLSGAATHPGGNITGLPAYNAAAVVARDLGLDPWWKPPEPRSRWRGLA